MTSCSRVRFACVFALSAAAAVAQDTMLVDWCRSEHLPLGDEAGRAVALADLDGDGAPELVTANRDARRLFWNDGAGHFLEQAGGLPAPAGLVVAMVVGDVDGDGLIDLVIGYSDRAERLLRGALGGFVDGGDLPAHAGETRAMTLFDGDGDGDLDLFVATRLEQDRLLWNDGGGAFVDGTAGLPARSTTFDAVVPADLDGDGAIDLVVGGQQIVEVLVNDGAGGFRVSGAATPDPRTGALAIDVGDVDGDGELDLLLGTEYGFTARLWLGDGSLGFVDGSSGLPPRGSPATYALRLVDVDGDGDLDALIGEGDVLRFAPAGVRLWENDGAARFTDASPQRLPVAAGTTRAIVTEDVDGDGDRDVLLAHEAYTGFAHELLLNDGGGSFVGATEPVVPVEVVQSSNLVAADVDGDGDLDLAVGVRRFVLDPGHGVDVLLRFDAATGRFEREELPGGVTPTTRIRAADLDGDGRPELVVSRSGGASAILVRDASGHFVDETAARLPSPPSISQDVVVGDVDLDGDLDLVFAEGTLISVWADRLFLNDGNGVFADASVQLPGTFGTQALALVDVDGDDDLDLLRVGYDPSGPWGGAMLMRNDGSGRFAHDALAFSIAGPIVCLAVGDVDLDGDQDVFVGRVSDSALALNDGGGRFTLTNCPPVPGGTDAAAFGDLDGDGWLDLVRGDGAGLEVWLGDRSGCFVDRTVAWVPRTRWVSGIRLQDLDDDGDLDVLVARSTGIIGCGDRALLNRVRHVSMPWRPIVGRELAIDVAASPGTARWFHLAIPLLAPERARLPIPPFGVLGLRADALMQLDPLYVPPGAGTARTALPVPNDVGLIGAPIHAQAVLLDPFGARLTNVATTVAAK